MPLGLRLSTIVGWTSLCAGLTALGLRLVAPFHPELVPPSAVAVSLLVALTVTKNTRPYGGR